MRIVLPKLSVSTASVNGSEGWFGGVNDRLRQWRSSWVRPSLVIVGINCSTNGVKQHKCLDFEGFLPQRMAALMAAERRKHGETIGHSDTEVGVKSAAGTAYIITISWSSRIRREMRILVKQWSGLIRNGNDWDFRHEWARNRPARGRRFLYYTASVTKSKMQVMVNNPETFQTSL